MKITLNNEQVNQDTLQVEDVFQWDYPAYCDAFFSYGEYFSGLQLDDNELNELGEKYTDLLNEMAYKSRFS